LGNVVSGTAPPKLDVAIKYKVGTDTTPRAWTGGDPDGFISRVSVFDTHCATVYLNDKTNVAFLPFGLDLFDKLVKACKAVRTLLEADQRTLNSNALTAIFPAIPEGTAAARLLNGITALTKPEAVVAMTRLSEEEEKKRALFEQTLRDLQANDPEKLLKHLTLRAGRVRTLIEHLKGLESALGERAVTDVFNLLHVVPLSIRNAGGDWVESSSILRHRISITPADRNAVEMLNEICEALSRAAGSKVGFASGPLRALYASRTSQGANNEPARDVLMRTLEGAGGSMTWKLLFAPDVRMYALNIEPLPRIREPAKRPGPPQTRGGEIFGER